MDELFFNVNTEEFQVVFLFTKEFSISEYKKFTKAYLLPKDDGCEYDYKQIWFQIVTRGPKLCT